MKTRVDATPIDLIMVTYDNPECAALAIIAKILLRRQLPPSALKCRGGALKAGKPHRVRLAQNAWIRVCHRRFAAQGRRSAAQCP